MQKKSKRPHEKGMEREKGLKGLKDIIPPKQIIVKPKYAVDYLEDYPNPELCYSVDKKGNFIDMVKPDVIEDPAMYHQKHTRRYGIMILFGAVIVFMSLAQAGDSYINGWYIGIISILWMGINLVINTIFGFLA